MVMVTKLLFTKLKPGKISKVAEGIHLCDSSVHWIDEDDGETLFIALSKGPKIVKLGFFIKLYQMYQCYG